MAVAQTAVAVADAQAEVADVQAKARPTAQHAVIHAEQDAGMVEPVVEPTQILHLEATAILPLAAMPISPPTMMPTSSRVTTRNPPTTHRAISAPAPRKSAIARAAAVVMEVVAEWAANAAKGHARPLKVVSLTRCAPAWT